MKPKLRILLADDHKVLRDGLRALLEGEDDMEVVAEAADGIYDGNDERRYGDSKPNKSRESKF